MGIMRTGVEDRVAAGIWRRVAVLLLIEVAVRAQRFADVPFQKIGPRDPPGPKPSRSSQPDEGTHP